MCVQAVLVILARREKEESSAVFLQKSRVYNETAFSIQFIWAAYELNVI